MRNPLSAIIHCADALLETTNQVYTTYERIEEIPTERRGLLDTARDSAQTILQCANHQRRIVDDVLTMSKVGGSMSVFLVDGRTHRILAREWFVGCHSSGCATLYRDLPRTQDVRG